MFGIEGAISHVDSSDLLSPDALFQSISSSGKQGPEVDQLADKIKKAFGGKEVNGFTLLQIMDEINTLVTEA